MCNVLTLSDVEHPLSQSTPSLTREDLPAILEKSTKRKLDDSKSDQSAAKRRRLSHEAARNGAQPADKTDEVRWHAISQVNR